MNAIKSLSIKNFTAFREAEFEFSPGINIFIGENSTGKTHFLKIIYALLKASEQSDDEYPERMDAFIPSELSDIFQTEKLSKLVRYGTRQSDVRLYYGNNYSLLVTLRNIENWNPERTGVFAVAPRAVYMPGREMLSIYPGFIAMYLKREVPYDKTYFDLTVSLNANLLRQPQYDEVKYLNEPLEKVVVDASKITLENDHFYIELPDAGKLEAQLIAEGYRKLATLMHLIRNGSLGPGSVLLWDEPEANLNPKLITAVVEFLIGLSKANIQVFLATHDYLLANELSLQAEYNREANIKFFSLSRPEGHDGVLVESGNTLAEIANNPILEAYVAHSDRENELAYEMSATEPEQVG